jgi:hypothetical protein
LIKLFGEGIQDPIYSLGGNFVKIDLGNYNDYNHFMLAVSVWASEKNREKALHPLKVAQSDYIVSSYNYLDSYYPSFLKTSEFSDVKDDPEFLKVLGQK